jgi:hypothetical protein
MQFFEDRRLVVRFTILQYPLDNPTAVRMCRQNVYLALEGFDDELDML